MNKRVLILILNSGEGEYKESIKMLNKQTYKNWQKIVFRGLNNKEAHDTLYSYIMNHNKEFDLFIKLDADMVLLNETILEKIVNYFEKNPNMDQGNFAVHDVMSDQDIMGLLVFSNKAKWNGSNEKLFVDYTPTIPGKRLLVWGKPSPVAWHCPSPTGFQAFHYGAHRAMKAVQKNRNKKSWIQSVIQWHLLYRVWMISLHTKDIGRALMLAGAYSVWKDELDEQANEYKSMKLRQVFRKYRNLSEIQIYKQLEKWGLVLLCHNLLYMLLWPKLEEYKLRCKLATWHNNYLNSAIRSHSLIDKKLLNRIQKIF